MLQGLPNVAAAMVANGKGLLAADESTSTIKKRFDAIGVDSTFETRRDYREMLFRTAPAMRDYLSGVILFDETIRQNAVDGTSFVKLIEQAGGLPGIKVDAGAKPMAKFPGETLTEGLDGLRERLTEYRKLGARFAKWRAVIDIDGAAIPSFGSIHANCEVLAFYAALCQDCDIVPIVEPEVLMDGAHTIERCREVTEWVLKTLYVSLYEQRVDLEGSILKPNMVVPGKLCPQQASVEQVAEQTIKVLKACVPSAVPGIAYLSGGQSEQDATAHLNAMVQMGGFPWKMTFSYGRALQAAPQKAWGGVAGQVAAGQAAFNHRAHMNYLAALGKWSPDLEQHAA